MIKVLFYTTAVEHTTFRKTARMLKNAGAEVKMYGFTRNNFPSSNDGLDVEILGEVTHGNYLKRIKVLFNVIFKLRTMMKDYDVIHCFTLDTLIVSYLACLFMNKKVVYQVQDIRSIFFSGGVKECIFRFLERVMLKRVDFLIVSSVYYYNNYFRSIYSFPESKVIVIENKLEKEYHKNESALVDQNKIHIGYFGVLRCKQSWDVLKEVAKRNSNVIIYVRGKVSGIDTFDKDLSLYSNIIYEGVYESPKDLPCIYNQVDIVWAAYPYGNGKKEGNWTMARTIRFYESGAFGKPVIVQEGTADSIVVKERCLGLIVDMSDINLASKCISENLNISNLNKWNAAMSICPKEYFVHKDEYAELIKLLKKK